MKINSKLKAIYCDHRNTRYINNINMYDGIKLWINEYENCENDKFEVTFYEEDKKIYSNVIISGQYINLYREWYFKWQVKVKDLQSNNIIFDYKTDLKNKKVLIVLNTKSLGDMIAWLPQVEQFRKKHNCKIICWLNDDYSFLFKKGYSKFKFISGDNWGLNVHAKYVIGWETFKHSEPQENILTLNNFDKFKENYQQISLTKHASNTLGLDEQLIKPKLWIPDAPRNIKGKYVCISTHSTAQSKYWNYGYDWTKKRDYGVGWQEIINYLNEIGYKVVVLNKYPIWGSSENFNEHIFYDVIDKTGEINLLDRIIDLKYADFYIGLNSGISWLAWAIGTAVINIVNLHPPEFFFKADKTLHQNSDDICHDCCLEYAFQRNDWMFCPRQRNTDRQFECSTTITPKMVIKKIKEFVNENDLLKGLNERP